MNLEPDRYPSSGPLRARLRSLVAVVLLLGFLPLPRGAEPAAGVGWGPLRPGDEITLREFGGFFAIEAGPGTTGRLNAARGQSGLSPGQLGFILRRIEVQPQGTFLVLGPLPPTRPEVDFETWIPAAFVRQVRVWK
jgi:hypothetical protein